VLFDVFKKSDGGRTISTSRELSAYLSNGGVSSGVAVNANTASKFAPVFACVKVLAESIGQLPLNLFLRLTEDSKEKARNHPLYTILHDTPNDYQTAQEFLEMCIAHICLSGNFYAFINRSSISGQVMELLPLQPNSVQPKQMEDYSIVYEITFPNGSKDVLDFDQVLHIKNLTLDGFTGVSNITHARESIGLGIATEKHGGKMFSNGAKPGGILSTDKVIKKEEREAMREEWNLLHSGTENSHKTAILQGGLTWTQVGLSSDDAQFLETRKFQRSEIAGIFRVPPHMIGDLERATFTNIEHQGLEFVVYSLMPYIRRIEQRIFLQLIKDSERARYYAKFNVNSLLRGDMQSRANFYRTLFNLGAISSNEIRAFEDMNPRQGGDEYFIPLNMVDSEDIGNDEEKQA